MKFKKLHLYGFKSFVDKTELDLSSRLTAIVGPNGCGKSNVSDSIRWVMGEQSAKSLRGGRMEDVIFHGTATRKPLGMAEVSLVIDNTDGSLPIDYSEVVISRRLFRSGESEYLINNSACRLKDVEELFLDTGAGHHSYSILEQGQLDLVLSIKPADRRFLFEEAAGIAKYKARKEEALRKLEATEQNLLRLSDIIAEVKRQINSIERQAKRAEKYREVQQELKTIELRLANKQYNGWQNEISRAEHVIAQARAQAEQFSTRVSVTDAQVQELRLNALEKEKNLAKCMADIHYIDTELGRADGNIGLLRERLANLDSSKHKASAEIELLGKKLLNSGQRQQKVRFELTGLETENAKLTPELEEQKNNSAKIKSDLSVFSQELEKTRTGLFEVLEQLSRLRNQLSAIEASVNHLKKRQDSLARDMEQVSGGKLQLIEIKNNCEQSRRKMEDLASALQSVKPLENTENWAGVLSQARDLVYLLSQINEMLEALDKETLLWDNRVMAMDEERRKLEAERAELNNNQKTLKEHIVELEKKYAEKQSRQHALQQSIDKLHVSEQEISRNLADAEVRLAQFGPQVQHRQQELFRLDSENEENDFRIKQLRQELDSVDSNKDKWQKEIKELEAKIEQLFAKKEELEKQKKAQEEDKNALTQKLSDLERSISQNRREWDRKNQEISQFELSNGQTRMYCDNLVEKIKREYQIDLSSASAAEPALPGASETETAMGIEEMKSEVERLNLKLKEIGPVNLVAMEEYEELSKRHEFLSAQEQDLRQAKDSLHDVITNINQTTRKLFQDTFDRVRENFKKVFQRLFQGGEADLMLVDEADLMETGIEIVARPPGKRLQNITLLSGGEKALTAVALLFALFMVKPSPFCILDEIDAPLDEANVLRFAELLKEFVEKTQFILITHNKRTMEEVEILYGITMEEAGVSRVISVRLKENQSSPAPSVETSAS